MIDYCRVMQLWAEKNRKDIEYVGHYGEPGYSDPEKGIIFTNWNDVPKKLIERIENAGYACEWSDEWYCDYDHDKAWRTVGDSWGWTCSLMFGDGYVLTPDDDIQEWIDACEITNHYNTVTAAMPTCFSQDDIEAQGWKLFPETYENGFHPGMDDNPKKIAKKLLGDYDAVLFQIQDAGQFHLSFKVYTRKDDDNE
jgi:hypothetical protein